MKKGIVIKSTGSRYRVLLPDGMVVECTIRGKFRTRSLQITNPVAVGDRVVIDLNAGEGTAVISEIEPRKNYIIRKSSNLSKESQILAANVDQLLLMITVKHPETPVEFIDRFLATAEAYRVKAVLLFNKTDLCTGEDTGRLDYLVNLYTSVGYLCLKSSLVSGTELSNIIEILKDKTTLVAGNSGVGKSTLLNTLNPDLNLKTGEISDYHLQGKHITTFPEMHPMPFGGFVIDSPGIRGFGVTDMDRSEIYHFFPEIFKVSSKCRFYNCLHLEEPGCAVREAVEKGEIDWLRYRSYINILEDSNSKYR